MDYLPLFIDLRGAPVLVVGGGAVALRKARLLARAGAQLAVVAPELHPELAELVAGQSGVTHQRRYQASDLAGRRLVVLATADSGLNRRIASQCREAGIAVNVVDQPQACSVIFPAIVERAPLTIAVSSGGAAPVLTRNLRAMIETMVPAGYGRLAAFAGEFRDRVRSQIDSAPQRLRFWENALQGPVAEMLLAGRDDEARLLMERTLQEPTAAGMGEVYLIGGGPGDPDLLTFKALRLMQRADVVLYDRLVAPAIVELCRREAERVYVGKRRSEHAVPQGDINQLLLRYALEGKRVVRLKGGDPFIFGRGGEEIEQLAEHGVPFQVVPGITAASGCACYAGIPLTHRDFAQSVRFVTGHLKDGGTDLHWDELVDPGQTVVFYMGLSGLPGICRALIAHGRSSGTPVAVIEKGTTARQRVIVGQLGTIDQEVERAGVGAPTLTIVGEVVALREKLRWFGDGEENITL